MNSSFSKLTDPTPEIARIFNKWANDPIIIPFMRPILDKQELEEQVFVTVESLLERLKHNQFYLIYYQGQLVGEMNFQIDPGHLFKSESGTAWIGIVIGEASARGKGVGTQAMQYLERQIQAQGLTRIELGVFEFNTNALKLYKNMGYQEIGRIDDFTYWQDRMWQDIRMEKYLIDEIKDVR